ncbi:MAG: hypothetical protein GEV09_11030 [Pseudonocardiaceae bacterium]|nr:hypothetical protein [Pseudonocardiaceae bacterium]
MNFAIMCTAFGLLIFLRKKPAKPWMQWVKGGLAAIGGASLAETGIGVWASGLLSDAGGLIADLFGTSAGLVVGVATLITTVVVCWDIGVDRKVDKPAMAGLIVLPLLFLAAVGPLADVGSGLTASIAQVGAESLGRLIGG